MRNSFVKSVTYDSLRVPWFLREDRRFDYTSSDHTAKEFSKGRGNFVVKFFHRKSYEFVDCFHSRDSLSRESLSRKSFFRLTFSLIKLLHETKFYIAIVRSLDLRTAALDRRHWCRCARIDGSREINTHFRRSLKPFVASGYYSRSRLIVFNNRSKRTIGFQCFYRLIVRSSKVPL